MNDYSSWLIRFSGSKEEVRKLEDEIQMLVLKHKDVHVTFERELWPLPDSGDPPLELGNDDLTDGPMD